MRWQDITDDKEKYAAYLCSREWAEKRRAVIVRAGGKCERCSDAPIYAVHHLTYLRKYNERLEDLQGLCEKCHAHTHAIGEPVSEQLRIAAPRWTLDSFDRCRAILRCPICDSFEFIGEIEAGESRSLFNLQCNGGHDLLLRIGFDKDYLLTANIVFRNGTEARTATD